jgi:hypothetical protein
MTTRLQRECLIRLAQADKVFDTEACRPIWAAVFPRRATDMHSDFPIAVQRCVRAYLETGYDPSAGEMHAATKVLYRGLMQAIEAGDLEAAAMALESVPEPIRRKLDRRTPGGIPTPEQIRHPELRAEGAKELLGCCVMGADIVPGRQRPNHRSRPRVAVLLRFKQKRGYPRQDAEAMLVRALAEYWRSLNGRFPRSCTRDPGKRMSPFERLVDEVLRRCGASGVTTLTLVRRTLDEMRDAEAGHD